MSDAMLDNIGDVSLKASLRRAERRNRLRSLLLVAPLFVFIMVTFLFPIVQMMYRSVDNHVVSDNIPKTVAALEDWNGRDTPDEAVFATLAREFMVMEENGETSRLAKRLNYEQSGVLSLFKKTARVLRNTPEGPYKPVFLDISRKWGEPEVWRVIRQNGGAITASYYLAAVDLRRDADGGIVPQPDYKRIYLELFFRTLWISLLVTFLCFLAGFPIAYLMASLPVRHANLLMILVLLPFWTSLLVRTTSWIALLQSEGVLNDVLVWLGLVADDGRVQMMFNQTGSIIAMTHILMPFMVLPLYSVMRTIPPSYTRAARSLGASPALAFRRVYFPQTLPGIGAGSILVFILSVGYYITPALVGGQSGQLISNMIAYHMQKSLNWGLAGALSVILLAGVMLLYMLYNRLVGVGNLKLG